MRKVWLEDLVVNAVMAMIMDDSAIDAIVSMLMDLQDRENTNLPLYERQLAEINTSIENLLNAIQQGILTRSTKTRLEELEAARDEAEARIACEKMASPKISEDFMRFWLHRFRKLDVQQQNHRQMLVDSFINTIFLYDDKIVITFNYKEGTKTVTLDDANKAVTEGKSSDLDSSAVPTKHRSLKKLRCFSLCRKHQNCGSLSNAGTQRRSHYLQSRYRSDCRKPASSK